MSTPSSTAYVVAFDESADRAAVEAVLARIVQAGGNLVVVAGHGVVVRVADEVADSLSSHRAVAHIGEVTLPTREPVRIRRPVDPE